MVKHKVVIDARHKLVSSNLGMVGFYEFKKMSLEEY